ncbi:hypothetical protein [Symbioplanes lichenis]|uniref:hypothetical protein n=1 Tax=Symbioplanes lichenis TaxID=1629072 RepID=UPI0027381ADA|nr:hypothetical protein [Actinoplanes lichenis]
MTDSDVKRGAAEDGFGVPVTPTEVEASNTPPSKTAGAPDSDASSSDAGDEQSADQPRES